jgi:hypothetical protein
VDSEIRAECAIENQNPSIFEIADIVRSVLACPVDFIAFQNRGAYEVILDLCVDEKTGKQYDIPVFEPFFDGSQDGLCFDRDAAKIGLNFPHKAASVPQVATALNDLNNAIRYPRRTFEHCRMAIEVMRSYFDPDGKKSTETRIAGEEAMCAALRIARPTLNDLEAIAARSRHGALVYSINYESRRHALELSWEAVARFIAYLEGRSSDGWKLLDQRFQV